MAVLPRTGGLWLACVTVGSPWFMTACLRSPLFCFLCEVEGSDTQPCVISRGPGVGAEKDLLGGFRGSVGMGCLRGTSWADTVSGPMAPLLWKEAFGVSEFPSMA